MPRWLPRLLWILLSLALAGFAYGPLKGAGPVGEDFQVLDDVSRIAWHASKVRFNARTATASVYFFSA